MMVVDCSAILAVLFKENDAEIFRERILCGKNLAISAVNMFEASIVMQCRFGTLGIKDLDQYVFANEIQISSVGAEHLMYAREAYVRFGKGNHPARLNFGDCFAYALAKSMGAPLLFKGTDFAKTDIMVA
jgi:ribonuclease VapC